jgi:tRNA pseudouridine(55) synthase
VAITIYKAQGETPLQALERFRIEKPEYAYEKLSYAGRLDPMAEGLMLVLVGEENKEREKYLGLDKTYVTEILFGVSTDTGDVLGLVKEINTNTFDTSELEITLKKSTGKFSQRYPVYSSKSFDKDYKSVHDGKLSDETHGVEMYSAELLDVTEITAIDLLEQIKEGIAKVTGDFRQEIILEKWQEKLNPKNSISNLFFTCAKIRLQVSSGFYVRQCAEDVGAQLGRLPALALSILRERVGDYSLDSMMKK